MLFASTFLLCLLARAAECLPRRADGHDTSDIPDKLPVIDPPFDFDGAIENGLRDNLPSTSYTIEPFTHGEIPLDCKIGVEQRNYTASDFDVFSVTYEDCGQPWIMCRYKDAAIDADEMATTFGKMPLGMREFIKHVFVVKPAALPNAAAISSGDSICISDESYKLYILAHEMSHSLDSHVHVPGICDNGLSATQYWHEQYENDSATVSLYARTKWPEKVYYILSFLAEVGIIGLYDNVVPGGLGNLPQDAGDIYHQWHTYRESYRDIITPRKKPQCTSRAEDSPLVNAETGARISTLARPNSKVGITTTAGSLSNHTCELPLSMSPAI